MLASTVTTIIVFFPVMFLFGVAKYLFSALALAVVLSMVASYVVAMTVIPIYCARFLTAEEARADRRRAPAAARSAPSSRAYDRFAVRYERMLERALDHKLLVIGAVAVLFVVSMAMFPLIGTELFPSTDAGQFIINYPRARRHADRTHRSSWPSDSRNAIHEVIPPDELSTIVSNLGLAPGFSSIYSPNAGARFGLRDGGASSPTIKSRPSYYMRHV